MESLGDILKRLGPTDSLRNISEGAASYLESESEGVSCPTCNDLGWVSRRVPVGHRDFGEVFPCRCQEALVDRNRQVLLERYSGLPAEMMRFMTFGSFTSQGNGATSIQQNSLTTALTAATAFAEAPEGWLLLSGDTGCGKTHLAVAIAGHQISNGSPALFTIVPDLLDHLRATFRPTSSVEYDELFEQVRSVPLLLLDDLGSESSTPWAQEKLYQIMVHRHNNRLPTVITTNHMMDKIEEVQPRLASRLKDISLVNWVPMSAPDYRDSTTPPPGFTR